MRAADLPYQRALRDRHGAAGLGGSVAICERFSARKFWDQCGEAEVTWFSVVPTIVSHLLHSDERPDVDTRERIRFGRSASSRWRPRSTGLSKNVSVYR